MHVVSVINYKGGVGKTTITANLGAELARRGKKVLLIDLDPQSSLTFSFFDPDYWKDELRDRYTIKRWFDGLSGGGTPEELGGLVVPAKVANAYLTEGNGRLDIIASHLGLITVDLDLATQAAIRGKHEPEFFRVRGALAGALGHPAFARYDLILFDCPPNFNIVAQTAIIASDHLVIPAKADYLSTLGIEYLYGNVSAVIKRYNDDAKKYARGRHVGKIEPSVLGVIFTMIEPYRNQPISSQRFYIGQVKALGLPVFETTIRESPTLFGASTPRGVPVVLRDRVKSPAVDELRQFTSEFLHTLRPERAAA
ncbi:MAG TPA: ParA family protein [Kribbellaceae bacterium]|nr:ParA family protein [Kribbellaceae bacterium]